VTVVVVVVSALLFLGVLAYTRLEIYSEKEFIPYSRQALDNKYLALDRWLAGAGHPVRVVPSGGAGTLEEGPERYVCIQASCFDWDGAEETILPWVEKGGRLVIFTDLPEEEYPASFLAALGLRAESYHYVPDKADDPPDEKGEEGAAAFPALDTHIAFYPAETEGHRGEDFGSRKTVEDTMGYTRIVTVYPGEGSVTVAGRPFFMQNYFIDELPNARLAWQLTGAALEEQEGLLFIRRKKTAKHFFGRLVERGNPLPPVLSALILAAAGFWMVIPSFGIPLRDEESPFRPIRDRFLAEIRFLKKYGSLDVYTGLYMEELKKRSRGRDAGELAVRLMQFEEALKPGKKLPFKKVVLYLKKLEDMAEHL
jgi:hypothetical protein